MADERVWIRTDEAEDVAASIRQALRCWEMTADDPQAWKWVVLALHAALQGACVCHLLTTAQPVGALTKRNTKEWLTYFNASREDPSLLPPEKTELMALPDLLKSVRKAGSAGDGVSPSIMIDGGDFNWLRRFHDEIRNQFVHFEPRGWSIEVSGMSDLTKLVGRIVGEVLEAGWGFRHKDGPWREALRADLARLSVLA
jgi:hypothetical protein